MDWCEPKDVRDWFNRFFSLRSLTFILVILLLGVFEFRFDWMEKALGGYLSTTNRLRPETGEIWETDHDTQQARDLVDERTVDSETIQSNARGVADLSEIISLISDNQDVSISPDHFISLYKNLSSSIRSRLISPKELLLLRGENQWERTLIRKLGNQLTIYLINQNRVLREIVVEESTLVQIGQRQIPFEGSLEEWGALPEDIFTADRFFSALGTLTQDMQSEIMAQSEPILFAEGRPVRVGFSPQLQTAWVDIGFELANGPLRRVIKLPAHEWALWRLRAALEQETSGFAPIIQNPEGPIEQ